MYTYFTRVIVKPLFYNTKEYGIMQHWINANIDFQPSVLTQAMLRAGDLFIDIETTGLSKSRHRIYLIGLASYMGGTEFVIHQFFADRHADEPELLRQLRAYLQSAPVRRIITFNGNSFDLPFLSARATCHEIELPFESYELFDIYRECKKRACMLQLQGYRQKEIEHFLHIDREDLYSGGELIKIYENYTHNPDPEAMRLLQLHNFEDVRNMYRLMDIFAYDRMFAGEAAVDHFSIESYTELDGSDAEELIVTLLTPCDLPGELSVRHPVSGVYLRTHTDHVYVRIPLYQHMARMYYKDYKNYYYLPVEDMAVHKSVAMSVDPKYRQKATPETCYSWVAINDTFLNSTQLQDYLTYILHSFLPASVTPDQS